eukprot:TRINITY_DN11025_c0_g1_i1.p1 TRINITY_DN11025_c0_g1~~TRINITY_DN11025_c0_g1_i1.p1  ORF type:complete len:396 (+),score=69.42 TRINITY_DN11025_c0_g1_i1:263-1450(+)
MDGCSTVLAARAPGKIILCGEHAVVHGSAALAASLGIYTTVTLHLPSSAASNPSEECLNLYLKDVNLSLSWPVSTLRSALQAFEVDPYTVKACTAETRLCIESLLNDYEFPEAVIGVCSGVIAFLFIFISIVGFKPVTAIVSSELPFGSGLGSSAAFCVAASTAALAFSGALKTTSSQNKWITPNDDSKDFVNKWAFEGEKIIHGRPSGIDNTVSTFGQVVKFKAGKLTNIEKILPIKMLITNTKVGRNTKALLAGVSERALRHPKSMSAVFTAVDNITEEIAEIIQSSATDDASICENEGKLEELMEMNQGLLQCMGVSHPAIEAILQTTSRYKLSSKLTGAGGGGCVLTLLPRLLSAKVIDKLKADLENQGFQSFSATTGGKGVEISFQECCQ